MSLLSGNWITKAGLEIPVEIKYFLQQHYIIATSLWVQGVECNCLNRNGPLKLMIWTLVPYGSIRRCGLGGSRMLLWEWVLRSQMRKLDLVPIYVEFSPLSPVPCWPAYHHASCHDNNGFESESQPQLNVFLYKTGHGHAVSSQQ